jgi:hypothetical protein
MRHLQRALVAPSIGTTCVAKGRSTRVIELEGQQRAQVERGPAMRLMVSFVNWLLGLRPTYRFTRETKADRLLELRNVCYTLLDDLETPSAKGLQFRVDTATSANEFWHMRPRLFDAVSVVHGEGVAAQRLMQLDTLLRVHHDRRSPLARSEPSGAAGTPPSRRRRRASDEPRFLNTR